MRCFLTSLIAITTSAQAQVITTVMNGPYNDPATWSCSCIPDSPLQLDTLRIAHSISMGPPYSLPPLAAHVVHITNTGEVHNTGWQPFFLNSENILVEGQISLTSMYVGLAMDTMTLSGVMEVTNDLHLYYGPELVMDQGALYVGGDLYNWGGTISGDGSICVFDSIVNESIVTGAVDLCDASPTTTVPPFVDENTGTIALTVTYCAAGPCSFTGTSEAAMLEPSVYPNPCVGELRLQGVPPGPCEVVVRDMTGRPTAVMRTVFADELELPILPAGAYSIEVRSGQVSRTVVVIVE